ncbi:hypothetical protein ElyMa_002760400 [Elysia marginata]|uniref:Uncharacterized protein n=1 Tax=Elysia marginata TaxID=1093978 RepID=A0AAV4HMU5_9GAST|nr:hypothetical protein ElyMa_002760400 [Elysia marginata]
MKRKKAQTLLHAVRDYLSTKTLAARFASLILHYNLAITDLADSPKLRVMQANGKQLGNATKSIDLSVIFGSANFGADGEHTAMITRRLAREMAITVATCNLLEKSINTNKAEKYRVMCEA